MNIKIDQDRMNTIKAFAETYYDEKEVYESKRRGDAHDRERRISQTIMGKMAEEAIAIALETDTQPDYTLYPRGSQKPCEEPDLRKDEYAIHVKSTSNFKWGWTADPKTDHIVRKPNRNDIIALTEVNLSTGTVKIHGFIWLPEAHDKWSECVAQFMREKGKKALYWSDISEIVVRP